MRALFALCLFLSVNLFAQDANLAMDYFKKGMYEKALHEYKKLYVQSTSNINYINQIIASHQQLEQYDEAEAFLTKLISKVNYPAFYG